MSTTQEKHMEVSFAVDAANTYIANDWWVRQSPRLAPERLGNTATALIDGKDVMADIAAKMKKAEKYIYITDWMMTLGIHLVRDGKLKREDTLLDILRTAGERGVQVRVILWDSADKVGGIDNNDIEVERLLESGKEKSLFGIKYIAENENNRVSRHSPGVLWSHHQKSVVIDGKVAYLGGIDLCSGRWDEPSHSVVTDPAIHLPSVDYYNPCIEDPDYKIHPRMPWHDIHVRIEGPAVYDVELSFVQRWNFQKDSHENEEQLKLRAKPPTANESSNGKHKVQIVRSVSNVHVDTDETERSIYHAYVNAIRGARNFIYIENQYFVSNYGTSDVSNQIADLLADKVIEAIDDGRPFKIVLVIPSYPEGILETTGVREVMHYQYQTIGFEAEELSRGSDSSEVKVLRQNTPNDRPNGLLNRIVNKLNDVGVSDPWEAVFQYVSIYSLRNYGFINGAPVHEQIYVHTKAMIVDDQVAIIGSANINDRSQLGDRDSELAAVIEDDNRVKVTFNENPVFVREFAHNLRKQLWGEHLGLDDGGESVVDFFKGFDMLREIADKNTSIYEEVFPDVPSDNIRTMKKHNKSLAVSGNLSAQEIRNKLGEIKGHITRYPLKWLFEEDLHNDLLPSTPFVFNDYEKSVSDEESQSA